MIINPNEWTELFRDSFKNLKRMSCTNRFSSIPVVSTENIAEHSYYVSVFSLMIHQKVCPDKKELIGPLAHYAITHDMDECVTGDVVRVFKYISKEFKESVDKASEETFERYAEDSLKDFMNIEFGLDEEEKRYINLVVKAADFWSLMMFMRREAAKMNREIIPFYLRFLEDLRMMAEKQKEIEIFDFMPSPFYYAILNYSRQMLNECFGNVNLENWDFEV